MHASTSLNRRSFLAGSGVALATGAAAASLAHADEAVNAQAGDTEAELVIVGSGMGGLCAGVEALQQGLTNVVIVEISKWTGGGSSWAYGAIHAGSAGKTDETFDEFTQYEGTDELSHAVFGGFQPLLHWVEDDLKLPVQVNWDIDTPFCHMLNADGVADPTSTRYFFDCFVELFESLGGQIMTQTRAKRLVTDEAGAVTGVVCEDAEGAAFTIKAGGVVLATGGWQNDTELKSRYLGPEGAQTTVMGTPYNTGSGLKMATAVGASLQGNMSQWSGCFVVAEPARNWMEDVEAYEQYGYDEQVGGKWWLYDTVFDTMQSTAIWVNSEGKRFTDENLPGLAAKQVVSRQRRSSMVVIMDQTGWDEWMATPACGLIADEAKLLDIVTSDEVGGAYFSADTIEDLADQLNAAGPATYKVHKANLVKTIEEYNAAAEAGTGDDLFPPKSGSANCAPIVEPPFYAVPMRAAIYANYGGVAIDTNAQVLDVSRKPIPGLYATVPCAGGVFHEFYTGTIAGAGVTGRMAADAAAKAILG